MSRFLAVSIAGMLLASVPCQARDLAVVVNRNHSASQLTAVELKRLLTTGRPRWPDGTRMEIFMSRPDSAGGMILERAFKLKPEEMKTLTDARRGSVRVVESDEAVLTLVNANAGAVGIVNVYSINSRVKVLKVDGKLPMEAGYLLHGN